MDYITLHQQYKEHSLFGRYIALQHIESLLQKIPVEVVGKSVLDKPIYKYIIGTGKIKIFMWSQMHGNEGTTTKALFDFFNVIHSNEAIGLELLQQFTFCFLPMVNPDGAEIYTRENANSIDLNRDAKNRSQPESIVLRNVFEEFQPHFCYNLHDQRTIYSAGDTDKPATVSFLAPAYNESREINEVRIKAMDVIVAMNDELQKHIPNQVGRFDDSFNDNCIGDTFQSLNVPTILFEAGHYQDDYYREYTRKMIFIALLSGLQHISNSSIISNKTSDYLIIPQNKVCFYDFVYKNVKINYDGKEKIINFAAHYEEVLKEGEIHFFATIVDIGELKDKIGHYQYNAHKMSYSDLQGTIPVIGEKADFCFGKNVFFVNGLKK